MNNAENERVNRKGRKVQKDTVSLKSTKQAREEDCKLG